MQKSKRPDEKKKIPQINNNDNDKTRITNK
jgi:hypothetical protein